MDEQFSTDPFHVLQWLLTKATQVQLLTPSKEALTIELGLLFSEFGKKISKIELKPDEKSSHRSDGI